jgi:hypothetical protein
MIPVKPSTMRRINRAARIRASHLRQPLPGFGAISPPGTDKLREIISRCVTWSGEPGGARAASPHKNGPTSPPRGVPLAVGLWGPRGKPDGVKPWRIRVTKVGHMIWCSCLHHRCALAVPASRIPFVKPADRAATSPMLLYPPTIQTTRVLGPWTPSVTVSSISTVRLAHWWKPNWEIGRRPTSSLARIAHMFYDRCKARQPQRLSSIWFWALPVPAPMPLSTSRSRIADRHGPPPRRRDLSFFIPRNKCCPGRRYSFLKS